MLPDRANMYSDSDDSGDSSAPQGPDDGTDSISEGQTALLPKSVFGQDVKPGDQINLKVVSIQGDEVMVEKSGAGEPPQDTGDDDAAPQPSGGDSSMQSMMSD